jgi:hypothetical protein
VDQGWAAVSTLIGGFVVWGGVGWLLDRWWGTHFAMPVGVILGMALGVYAVVMRYGVAATPIDAKSGNAPKVGGAGSGTASSTAGDRSGVSDPVQAHGDTATSTRPVPAPAPTASER